MNDSNFSDVFDEDHFISALAYDLTVIKKLPKELVTAPRAVKHFRSWSGIDYYQNEIASMWDDYQVSLVKCSIVVVLIGSFNHLMLYIFPRLSELQSLILVWPIIICLQTFRS